jgi:hypothetical protein
MEGDAPNLAMLQRLLEKRPPAGERCDFCATPILPEHTHLIELAARRILCACRPCALVFEPEGAAQGKYRAIPRRYLEIADLAIADAEWDGLQIPIGLAFFFYNSLEERPIAFYPSPAGATESQLPLETWNELVARHAELASLAPDVEALLVRRDRERAEAYVVPIDAAYELVGLIRVAWRGFDGGSEAHERIDAFFERVAQRAGANAAKLS